MATGTMGGCDPVVFEMAGCLFRVGGGSPEFAGASKGGGGPLGEDGGVAAEAVFHGGAAAFDEIAGFLDEGAVAGVVADVFVAEIGGESGFFAGATPANWMIGAST